MTRPIEAVAASSTTTPDPRLDEALKLLLAVGAVLVLLLPAARGSVASVGWLPMWLLGMPLVALWATRGFRLPWGGREPAAAIARPRRRRSLPQARRRARPAGRASGPCPGGRSQAARAQTA
ncbi:hypothetical protein [Aerolutibacter ruishenii]|uniref:Uncharacterized protein n=1 Tax=Aerolutibacter ruishenii TaxID=686800 RepID=A0A562M3M8_9GAMM|nr:hypothetical protein [Lysobacter ruishenii]TWI14422.1 hypothetical protein IP93_00419 [Lysobacter ruishenii]